MNTQETKNVKNEQPSGEGKSRYRATLQLPSTPFPMKANLVQNEPASMKRWQELKVYDQLRAKRKGGKAFNFHDGPPYANGGIHLGHLMNKCLKDFVVRSRSMAGFDVPYIPGWDCHGLPIEHKVMTGLEEAGKLAKLKELETGKRALIVRKECKSHAEKYIKLQMGQMQRLLTLADYAHPYLTMDKAYEAATLEVLADLLDKGLVYRAKKPVHWSIANETALAEAELEYQDREDLSVYVDFEALDIDKVYDAFGLPEHSDDDDDEGGDEGGEGASGSASEDSRPRQFHNRRPHQRPCFMIWTTTPWTLPANLAIAVNPAFTYALVHIDGNVTVLALEAVERVTKLAKSEQVAVIATTTGEKLLGLRYKHPFVDHAKREGAASDPDAAMTHVHSVVGADYVTLEDGTGLVHTAPGHGVEDYQTGLRVGLPIYSPVRDDGTYDASVPEWLRSKSVWEANGLVVKHLRESGHLFHDHTFMHSYPHDWRSKTPVIFRCTEQWFVGVERTFSVGDAPASLRDRALRAVEASNPHATAFVPEWGRNRMRGMLESRPDWCISRQRAWGLPIPSFVLSDGSAVMTSAMCRAVIACVREHGSDAWFERGAADLLLGYDPAQDTQLSAHQRELMRDQSTIRKGNDILDVWFESGSSWNSVLRARGLGYPADLYLEGSDQHRGWFQLSLLPAIGVTGTAPFRTLLTHGFMVDKDGRKLSKSRPDAQRYEVDSVTTEFGVDVMRWWVSSLAYDNDVKIDVEFFGIAGESYRKVRNTIRYLLSNLSASGGGNGGGDQADAAQQHAPTSLDAWVLGELDALSSKVQRAYEQYDFMTVHKSIFDFCNETLSATYLAAVKDRMYCDALTSPRRKATQAAMFTITQTLVRLLAPILPHTSDEAYRALRVGDAAACVHVEVFSPLSGVGVSPLWPKVMELVRVGSLTLERARAGLDTTLASALDNPLDAGLVLPDADAELTKAGFDPVDIADLLGVSRVTFDASAREAKVLDLRDQPRCERSWKRDGTVRKRSDGGMLSDRDAAALGLS